MFPLLILHATLGATLVAHNHLIARPHAFSWLFAVLWGS